MSRSCGVGVCLLLLLPAGCGIDRVGRGSGDGGARGATDGSVAVDAPRSADAGRSRDAGADRVDAGVDGGPRHGTLRTLRWEFPCEPGSHSGILCTTPRDDEDSAAFAGDTILYDVQLHFRGVLEEKSYSGGTQDGLFNSGGDPNSDPYTEAGVEVSDPPGTFYLNDGTSGRGRCVLIDYVRTIPIRGGADVRIWGHTSNTATNFNVDQATDEPIVVDGVPPAPESFDGQFIQVDLVSASPR